MATAIPRDQGAGGGGFPGISASQEVQKGPKSFKIRLASFGGGAYSSRSFVKNI
jgi:hypothetical protein